MDFTQYDRLFPYAVAQEPERLLVRLVWWAAAVSTRPRQAGQGAV